MNVCLQYIPKVCLNGYLPKRRVGGHCAKSAAPAVTELFAALGSEDAAEAKNAAQTLSQRSPLLGVHADEAHRRMKVLIDSAAGKGDAAGDVDSAVNELAAYIKKLVRAA